MMNVVRANAAGPGEVRGFCASRLLILILALLLAPAFADAQPARARLASLQVEIWPEYDRPAAALVILKGEIAANVPLPAAISLRIAASSGGPSAVAYAAELGGSLANLNYERKDAGDFITLTFIAPERVFHVEFYDPLVIVNSNRSYTYAWTGDLAADRLRVVVQEPATASDFSVTPALGATAAGRDGLKYRSADLGLSQAGGRLEVNLRYTKADPRTSAEILKPKAADSAPPPAAAPSAGTVTGTGAGSGTGPSKLELAAWLVGIVGVLGAGLGVWAAVGWWYGRKGSPEPVRVGAGFCRKCGAPSASGDRFCSKCGAKLG